MVAWPRCSHQCLVCGRVVARDAMREHQKSTKHRGRWRALRRGAEPLPGWVWRRCHGCGVFTTPGALANHQRASRHRGWSQVWMTVALYDLLYG